MENHYQLSDALFKEQFANANLDPTIFSHEAHLRLAWIHVTQDGEDLAAKNLCQQIAQFDRTHGDGTKFHTTLTVAAVKMIAHFLAKSVSKTFPNFIQEYPRLKTNFKDLILQHYSFDVFRDETSKKLYVEPDLLQF